MCQECIPSTTSTVQPPFNDGSTEAQIEDLQDDIRQYLKDKPEIEGVDDIDEDHYWDATYSSQYTPINDYDDAGSGEQDGD